MRRIAAAVRAGVVRVAALFGAARSSSDIADEMRAHIDMQTDDNVRAGMTPEDARRAALVAFGGVAAAGERFRERQTLPLVGSFVSDMRYGVRMLLRNGGTSALAIATLAIGVGATTAIFSMINSVLLTTPYPDADRIVWIASRTPAGAPASVSTLDYLDWKRRSVTLESLAGWTTGTATLTGIPAPRQLRMLRVSPEYFGIFGMHPVLGRGIVHGDDRLGADHVAVIGHELWSTQFGLDPGILGREIRLSGEPYEIVGVLPEGAGADWEWTEVWLPLSFHPDNMNRTFNWLGAYGKLRNGVTLAAARADMTAIAAQLASEHPDVEKGRGIVVERYEDFFVGPGLRRSLYVLFAAVGAVLLIGCVNLSSLMLARAMARRREIAIRSALGGSRARIVRQLLTEHLILAGAGGAAGVGVAYGLMAVLRAVLPAFASPGAGVPPQRTVAMDGRVLLFALAASIVGGLLAGITPSLASSSGNLIARVKEGTRAGGAPPHRRARRLLIASQSAMAVMLLATSGMLLQSLFNMERVETGFQSKNVVAATLPMTTRDALETPPVRAAYFDRLLSAIAAVPGIRAAALTSVLPLAGPGSEVPFQRADAAQTPLADRATCFLKMVTPAYFRVLALPVTSGRGLNEGDRPGEPLVAVANSTFARRFFPGENPVGHRVIVPAVVQAGTARLGPDASWEIVGVVADERVTGLAMKGEMPGLYVSMEQSPTRHPAIVARTEAEGLAVEGPLRRAVASVNDEQPLTDVRLLDDMKTASVAPERTRAWLLAAFAAVALVLSGIGIYGLMSCAVAQRATELGIRLALGATRRQAVHAAAGEGLAASGIGLVLGVAGAVAGDRFLAAMLFGVTPRDPAILAGAAVTIALVAACASYVPARRILDIDLSRAVRGE